MAIDLTDLVEFLRVEINPPGVDLFPGADDDEWVTRLRNAFWNARLDGLLVGYVESDGLVLPVSGTTDMARDLQQVIVFFAGYGAIMNELRNKRASLRAKAGPAEFEVTQAATVLAEQARSQRAQLERILARLADQGATSVEVIDAIAARAESIASGTTSWVGSG
jgi:hypothetical protein